MNRYNKTEKVAAPPLASKRLLDQVRERIFCLHYSLRTEEAYVYWVKKFIHFHHKRRPRDMGRVQVEELLAPLALVATPHALDALVAISRRLIATISIALCAVSMRATCQKSLRMSAK